MGSLKSEIIGTSIGSFRIDALLGAGGMGKVYRARDTKLGRDVAIKILPTEFASDPERLARFEREAQVLASLNHPHIATIYGVESGALVMELVDGPTLAERLEGLRAKGSGLPLDEALPLATQIAEALEAAHEQGIVHRDLKPANIKLTRDGAVKVLDFGLAKLVSMEGAGRSTAQTVAADTEPGMVVGTAAYMSPEQARGLPVDKRTDIWAFGCVLYEVLSGKQAFGGPTMTDVMVNIVEREPDWAALPASTPRRVRELLHCCLKKDPKQRLRDIGDARLDLQSAAELDPSVPSTVTTRWTLGTLAGWLVAGLLTLALAASWMLRSNSNAANLTEVRLDLNTPPTSDPVSFAISPDGKTIVFVATSDNQSVLWLRSLDSSTARPLSGTADATFPFWSPDNRAIGFFADAKLKRIDVASGSVQVLADAQTGRGGAWTRDDTIIFGLNTGSPLMRIPATGGQPVVLPASQTQQESLPRFPHILPDARHFLYYVRGRTDTRGVYVGELDGSGTKHLLDADGSVVYAPSGHLLFVRDGTLFAQRFDPDRLELVGNRLPIAEQVLVDRTRDAAAISVSAAGSIVYRTDSAGRERQLVWFDRSGKEIAALAPPDSASPLNPALSPNGRTVALQRTVKGNPDIWLLDVESGALRRFTSDAGMDGTPVWSPDGSRLMFSSNRNGTADLFVKSVTGDTSEELLLKSPQHKAVTDWSGDGSTALFRSLDPGNNYDLWAMPLKGDRQPVLIVQTPFAERDAQFSSDGKWIAYASNETGRFEIYVQRFPGPGAKIPVSANGGAQARWRRDGRELFYVAIDGRLMAVPIRASASVAGLEAGQAVPLFATRIGGAVQQFNPQQYLVSADGQRFLMSVVTAESVPMTVVLNWKPK